MTNFRRITTCAAFLAILPLAAVGCGGTESGTTSSADQSKMSPEEVQKELEKLSPPAAGKGKTKR